MACSKPEKPAEAEHPVVAKPVVQATTISIPTAQCENCEKTITNAVKGVDGVTDVQVDAKSHTAKVQYIAAKTDVHALENSISKAGYTANTLKRDSAAYEQLDDCCK
jgi:copper chaperone CopZ